MEKKYIVLVLAICGYIGAALGGIWGVVPSDVASNGKDIMMTIISIILAAITGSQASEIKRLKLKMGM
jgi:hypothetical protein